MAVHTPMSTKDRLAGNKAGSPDKNPIENLLGVMVWDIYDNYSNFSSVEKVKMTVKDRDKIG